MQRLQLNQCNLFCSRRRDFLKFFTTLMDETLYFIETLLSKNEMLFVTLKLADAGCVQLVRLQNNAEKRHASVMKTHYRHTHLLGDTLS